MPVYFFLQFRDFFAFPIWGTLGTDGSRGTVKDLPLGISVYLSHRPLLRYFKMAVERLTSQPSFWYRWIGGVNILVYDTFH